MGSGVLVVFVLCGDGFCVDNGGFSVGAGVWVLVFWWCLCCVVVGFVWIVVDFLWVLVDFLI